MAVVSKPLDPDERGISGKIISIFHLIASDWLGHRVALKTRLLLVEYFLLQLIDVFPILKAPLRPLLSIAAHVYLWK